MTDYVNESSSMEKCVESLNNEIQDMAEDSFRHGKIREALAETHEALVERVSLLLGKMKGLYLNEQDRTVWKTDKQEIVAHRDVFQKSWNDLVSLAEAVRKANRADGGISRRGIPHRGEYVLGIEIDNGTPRVGWYPSTQKGSRC
jgi:hypothetical protein